MKFGRGKVAKVEREFIKSSEVKRNNSEASECGAVSRSEDCRQVED